MSTPQELEAMRNNMLDTHYPKLSEVELSEIIHLFSAVDRARAEKLSKHIARLEMEISWRDSRRG